MEVKHLFRLDFSSKALYKNRRFLVASTLGPFEYNLPTLIVSLNAKYRSGSIQGFLRFLHICKKLKRTYWFIIFVYSISLELVLKVKKNSTLSTG
jgi:hypothetical protein